MPYDEEGLYGWILNAAALDGNTIPVPVWLLLTDAWDDAGVWTEDGVWPS